MSTTNVAGSDLDQRRPWGRDERLRMPSGCKRRGDVAVDERPDAAAEARAEAARANRAERTSGPRKRDRVGYLIAEQILGVTLRRVGDLRKRLRIRGREGVQRCGNPRVLAQEMIEPAFERIWRPAIHVRVRDDAPQTRDRIFGR